MIKKVQLKNLFLILLSFALIIFPIIIISANLTETQQIIARDSKRISDISTLYSKIEKYKTEYGNYPKIDSSDSSYKINGFVSSTMIEDWNNFSSSLGVSNIVDPINKNVRNIKVIASPYEPDIISTTCSVSPFDTGIYIDGIKIYDYTRGYIVSNFDSNWNHIETKSYDTYGSSQEAINMRDYIATISQENYIVIYTYDEPRQNIDIIWNTLLNLGASNEILDKIGNNPDCGYRSAYILVGKRNLYQNNAFYESWGPRGAGSCMGCPISHEFSVDSLNKSLYGDYGYTWTKGSSAYHYIYCPKDNYLEDDNCYTAGASQEEDSFYLELDLEDASRIEDWGLQDNPHIIYSKGDINSRIYSNNDSVCGNYVLEGREECEIGSSPKIEACVSGLESGYKVFNCDFNTCLYEEEDIENPKECLLGGIYCGDGVVQSENGEECEGGYEELCVKNFGDHNWYNSIVRYCNNSCKWNISDSVNLSDCIGYCGDMVVQEEYGEDCDDETSNCVGCKYINKSPTIEEIITSSVREDYEGDVITRETYETSGIFKDSKYFILSADASDKVSGYTYYKWKISRASNYEIDIRNSFTDITIESIDSIMKTDGSFETEYTEGLDSIRIYPTGSNLNPSGDEIFDHNYTGVYNVILYMKNRYTDTETGQPMDSREVSFLFDFAIGSVCGDHIVQTPNSQGKNEYCEWKKGYYRIPEIENGTAIYNTSVYGGGSGISSSDQYYCDVSCNDSGGWCMDGFLQVEFEKCDPSSVSSTFNVFGTGLNVDQSYGCDTSCQVSSNYCGDGYLTRDYEVCDPTYKVLSSESSSSLQYLCDNGIPNNNNMTPWVLSKEPDEEDDGLSGLDYVKNILPSAT
ncbi:MAG: hypothetical protein EOL97_14240, partial [Spirochaetia bacterium]|nr:hypothetical protein [Spirochaetia bacterium]